MFKVVQASRNGAEVAAPKGQRVFDEWLEKLDESGYVKCGPSIDKRSGTQHAFDRGENRWVVLVEWREA